MGSSWVAKRHRCEDCGRFATYDHGGPGYEHDDYEAFGDCAVCGFVGLIPVPDQELAHAA